MQLAVPGRSLVLAVYLFLRGHDLPGGGFVAGLTLSIALILQYMVGGTRWVEDRLRDPARCAGSALGLLLAIAHRRRRAGCSAIRSSPPTSAYLELPLIGEVPLRERAALRPRRLRCSSSARRS